MHQPEKSGFRRLRMHQRRGRVLPDPRQAFPQEPWRRFPISSVGLSSLYVKLMKLNITLCAVVMMILSATTGRAEVRIPIPHECGYRYTTTDCRSHMAGFPDIKVSALEPTVADAPGSVCRVTPEFVYPDNLAVCTYQFALRSEGGLEISRMYVDDPAAPGSFELEVGAWDFLFLFTGSDGIRCVLLENVDVKGDMKVSADASVATMNIRYVPLLPDGSEIRMERRVEGPDGTWSVADEGNVMDATVWSMVVYKGEPIVSFSSWIRDYTEADGSVTTNRREMDVWTTPGETLKYYQNLAVTREDGNLFIVVGSDPKSGGVYSNNPDDYSETISADFVTTSKYAPTEDDDSGIDYFKNGSIAQVVSYAGALVSSNEQTSTNRTWADNKARVCLDRVHAPEVEVCPQFMRVIYSNSSERKTGGILAPSFSLADMNWSATHLVEAFNKYYLMLGANNEHGVTLKTGNPALSFPYGEKAVFGDNAPVVVFLRPTKSVAYDFVGRYGELRTIDYLNHKLSVKCDGEEVCNSYWDLDSFGFSEQAGLRGPWTYVITDENLEVDGLQARTECVQSFVAAAPGGPTPTVMQMQVHGVNGEVTDRLSESEDGTLCFAAGSFTLKTNTTTWARWYEYSPLTEVKLEYAPYGTDSFEALEVKESTEDLFLPGYGAFYKVDLGQVGRTSGNKWYDVRISISDGEGNTQVQTVSPAFRIEKLSSVGSVSEDGYREVWYSGSSIVAPAGSRIYNVSGAEVSGDNPLPGVYIVVVNDDEAIKLIVK